MRQHQEERWPSKGSWLSLASLVMGQIRWKERLLSSCADTSEGRWFISGDRRSHCRRRRGGFLSGRWKQGSQVSPPSIKSAAFGTGRYHLLICVATSESEYWRRHYLGATLSFVLWRRSRRFCVCNKREGWWGTGGTSAAPEIGFEICCGGSNSGQTFGGLTDTSCSPLTPSRQKSDPENNWPSLQCGFCWVSQCS